MIFARIILLSVLMSFTFLPVNARAQDDKAAPAAAEEAPATEEPAAAPTPKTSEPASAMFQAINDFAKSLKPDEMQHFYLLYNNYNLLQTVDTVRGDVSNAVESCAKNNPDIDKKMNARFEKWNGSIEPTYKEAQAHLNNMIFAQEYAKPEKIRSIFNMVDKTREHTESQFEKTPVSTPEACEYLLGKMDETQDSLLSLLRATLITFPQALPGGAQDSPT